MEALLAAGADPHATTLGGQTPLHYHKGRVPVLRVLLAGLKNARDVDVRDKAGATPLHRAAGPGFTDACIELLQHGGEGGEGVVQSVVGNHVFCAMLRLSICYLSNVLFSFIWPTY